jgi:hypothetical protein
MDRRDYPDGYETTLSRKPLDLERLGDEYNDAQTTLAVQKH